MMQILHKSPLITRFAAEKKFFKELVQQYIDLGGDKDSLKSRMPTSLNTSGTDRIQAKINRFYKKHKPVVEAKGNLPALKGEIEKAAAKLADTFKEIDTSNIGTEEKPARYSDYRNAKGAYKKAAKTVLTGKDKVVLNALKQTLNHKQLGEKTVNKLDTFYKKFNKKKPQSRCNRMLPFVLSAVALALFSAAYLYQKRFSI